jgi:hypothetical protein
MAGAEGEPSNIEETAEGETHASTPQDDAEVDAIAERDEVRGSEIY